MPRLRIFPVFAITIALSGGGCGTFANLGEHAEPLNSAPNFDHERPTVFGGVGRDIRWISSGNIIFLADIPFSIISDVVTLPKVMLIAHDPHWGEEENWRREWFVDAQRADN